MYHEIRYTRLLPSYLLVALRDEADKALEWWMVPPIRGGWYVRQPLRSAFCIPSEIVPVKADFQTVGVPA